MTRDSRPDCRGSQRRRLDTYGQIEFNLEMMNIENRTNVECVGRASTFLFVASYEPTLRELHVRRFSSTVK